MSKYYIKWSFSWKCNVYKLISDIRSLELEEQHRCGSLLENTVYRYLDPWSFDHGYTRFDEAIVEFLTLLKDEDYPGELADSNPAKSEFYDVLNEINKDSVISEISTRPLTEDSFDITSSLHLIKEDIIKDYFDGRFSCPVWDASFDVMVASDKWNPFRRASEGHTVTCYDLDRLSPEERDDLLCYVGIDAQRGPKTFHVSPGFVSLSFDRVPFTYELARDLAEALRYSRPQDFVAFENILRSYMKDYGLSMIDDDWYSYNDVEDDIDDEDNEDDIDDEDNEDDIDDEDNEPDPFNPVNRLYLLPRVYFLLKEDVSQEILEKCDAEGYYWTPRERRRYIPYEDGYAIEYISRQHLKEMEKQTDLPPYLRYTY